MPPTISVQLDAVQGLAAELTVLAADVDDSVAGCRAAAASLGEALNGDEGWEARGAATTWALLVGALAERSGAVAATLTAAVAAYRAADAAWASRLHHDPGLRAGGAG